MRTHLLNCIKSGILTEFPSKPESRKKSLYTSPYNPTSLHLQNAREWSDVSVYEMSAMVPSGLPRNQTELWLFFQLTNLLSKSYWILLLNVFLVSWFSFMFWPCTCIVHVFEILYRASTELSLPYHGYITDFTRNFHGFTTLFTDSRKCHAVTVLSWISEWSRNYHGFTEHSRIQELRNFHGKFTELSWALKYLSHKS